MFYFVRHGQTDGNIKGKIKYYHDDIPLNEIGILEAQETGKYLKKHQTESSNSKLRKPFDLIISSPILRTRQTTEHIMKYIDVIDKNVIYDDRLVEGKLTESFEMFTADQDKIKEFAGTNEIEIDNIQDPIDKALALKKLYTKMYSYDKLNENLSDYLNRSNDFLEYLKKLYNNNNKCKVLIVCHGGTIDGLTQIIGTPFRSILAKNNYGKQNCIISLIEYVNERYVISIPMTVNEYRFVMQTQFNNHHLKELYDSFKPLFVLMTPYLSESNIWFSNIDFITKLKQIGEIYIDTPKFNNYLDKYDDDYLFNLEDIMFEQYSKSLYEKIKNKINNRKIIVIGNYISCAYAFHFANTYKDIVKGLFLIRNTAIKNDKYRPTYKINNDILHNMLNLYHDTQNETYQIKLDFYIYNMIASQYNKIPDKCFVPTYIYDFIKLDGDNNKNNLNLIKNSDKNLVHTFHVLDNNSDLFLRLYDDIQRNV